MFDGIKLNCISNNFKCSLCLSPADRVSHLTKVLAQRMNNLPSADLLLVCKGIVLSNQPESSLASLGLAVGDVYELLVIRQSVKPAWLRTTAYFLCSSIPPIQIPMRATRFPADFKSEVRNVLRIPGLCLSLHLADGEPLPDGASLRDLGVRDGGRVYCRIHTEDPPPAAAVEAGRVREQIRRAKELWEGVGGAGAEGLGEGAGPETDAGAGCWDGGSE
jgi:hypothetical protein